MIEKTKKIIEEYYLAGKIIESADGCIKLVNSAKVIYGDTDSVMIMFGGTF